jgi:hypothetical protein
VKIKLASRHSSPGYALLMVLSAVAALLLVMATTMLRTSSVARSNSRNQQYTTGLYAAEAAVEKVVARMRNDYSNGGAISNSLSVYRALVPTASEDPYWGNFQFSDSQGNVNSTYVQCISNTCYTLLSGPYAGLQGWSTVYRVLSNVRQPNSSYNITNALQQDLECDIVPMFQFAIFYNSLLEFTWAAPLTVRGSTHANSSIFFGSSSPLTFTAFVSGSGIMASTNWGGHTMSQYTGTITFATNVYGGYATNYPVLTLPIGTNNTPDAVRQVIDMPPSGESPTSAMGQLRYYNMAGMDLLVSNSTVTAIIKNSSTDPSPVTLVVTNYGTNSLSLTTNLPFLSVTNTFTDQREGKTVVASQIDMGKLSTWIGTNSSIAAKHPSTAPFNILYVADNRTVATNDLVSVRLTNGVVLPTAPSPNGSPTGFTVATPNPLYVWGNYNCTNSAYLNTTNTSATVPASLISDALTILSPSWKDSASAQTFQTGVRVATSTTVNAALLTGVVYTAGSTGNSPFSGGVVNLPRLLEDWGNGGSVTLTINTSMVNLYNSVFATAPWQVPGTYYYAPTRNFNFDQNFLNQNRLPPGTPMVYYLYRQAWTVPPPSTTNYYVGS